MLKTTNISFVPFGTELLIWATEKDQKYYTASKMASGMISYTSALYDLGLYFKKIATGELRHNSQTVSAWARAWKWDYRKALRFITIVLRNLFDLNSALKKAKALRERIEAEFKKQQEKACNYMRKFRGSKVLKSRVETNIVDNETEDERLFLDAMAELAKTNPVCYRQKIKEKLNEGDVNTVKNFQNWVQKNLKKETLKSIDSMQVEQILKDKFILGYRIIKYTKTSDDIYHLVFENYFENDMTIEQIIENAK